MDITIIIPAYNRLWSLPKAIESCQTNSDLHIQIIVVDDGSTDGTWKMLSKQTDIEVYKQPNWGKPWAVNKAFQRARGKYIKFLDSDDWLIPTSLKSQYDIAEKDGADVVVAGYDVYNEDQYIKTQEWVICDDFIAQNLGECDSSHYSAFLFRKEFINDIPHRTSFAAANFASRDDRCFMLEVALKEPKISVMKGSAFCHRSHRKQRLQFRQGLGLACTNYQHLLIYKNIIKELEQSSRLTPRRIDAALSILWPLSHWIAKYNINEAYDLLQWIYKLNPEFKNPETGILGVLYNKLGFKTTERLLRIRRQLKYT